MPPDSQPMQLLRKIGLPTVAWSLRRLHVPVAPDALVLEVGSGGNPYPRANVLLDAYESTRQRHFQPLIADRPTVLGLVEKMPFRDDAFDFVIASHVIEHSLDVHKFIAELQRVARAGYIEAPDAFFERLNPYRDHRLEITDRNGELVIRHKRAWRHDEELVELFEARVKSTPLWARQLRRNAFAFHLRFYWSRDTGGIRYRVIEDDGPKEDIGGGGEEVGTEGAPAPWLRKRIIESARRLLSQADRNDKIDLVSLLRCPDCGCDELKPVAGGIVCSKCARQYECSDKLARMMPAGGVGAG